jgi:hypothetical protein
MNRLRCCAATIALLAVADAGIVRAAASQVTPTILIPCKYPDGWTSTDATRDVNGIPPGFDHQCLVEYHPPGVIVAPCAYREAFSSINWGRVLKSSSVRVEYRCRKPTP